MKLVTHEDVLRLKSLYLKPDTKTIFQIKRDLKFKPDFDLQKEIETLQASIHMEEVLALQNLRASKFKKELNILIAYARSVLYFLEKSSDVVLNQFNQLYPFYEKNYKINKPTTSIQFIRLTIRYFYMIYRHLHWLNQKKTNKELEIFCNLSEKINQGNYKLTIEVNNLVKISSVQQSKPNFIDHVRQVVGIFINASGYIVVKLGNDSGKNLNTTGRLLIFKIYFIIKRGTTKWPTVLENRDGCRGTLFKFIRRINKYFNSPATVFLRKESSTVDFLKAKYPWFDIKTGKNEYLPLKKFAPKYSPNESK